MTDTDKLELDELRRLRRSAESEYRLLLRREAAAELHLITSNRQDTPT